MAVYVRTVAPTVEPVSLSEIKQHLRVDGADEDAYLTALITAGREMLCRLLSKSLITETWTLTLDDWPQDGAADDWWEGVREGPISMLAARFVAVERAPFIAIQSVALLDEDNASTAWASAGWYATKHHSFGRLHPKRGHVFPPRLRDWGGIVITFTAGYGPTAADVPLPIRSALMQLVGHWFENRLPASECASRDLMPMGLGSIIAQYRTAR